MKTLFYILPFIFFMNLSAQLKRNTYCSCEIKGTKIINDKGEKRVSLNTNYLKETIDLKVINNTKDTIFIFNSYFDNDISTSKYLYRYDEKKNVVNISYVPLLPYLFTKYSDKVSFENRIIKDYQVIYNFYKIPPSYEYSFSVPTINFKERKEFIKDFDITKLNKFQKIKRFKNIKVKKTNPSFIVNVTYYNTVDTLCNANSYYQDELKFDTAARDFKIIQSPIQ